MNKYNTEVFAEYTYAENMTYEGLLAAENLLLENLETIFRENGAEHLDFTPFGDYLMMQCVFETKSLDTFRDIANEIAAIMPQDVRGRLLCLEKSLSSYHLFWIDRGQWREKKYLIPLYGPENMAAHSVPVKPAESD